MRILFFGGGNYVDFPTGGIMNFSRYMLNVFGSDLALVGLTEKKEDKRWSKKKIADIEYDFFPLYKYTYKKGEKPLIPMRLQYSYYMWRNKAKIFGCHFDYIFVQDPETLYFVPDCLLDKVIYVAHGLSNPLSISRYKWARSFARYYDDFFFFPKLSKLHTILATADKKTCEAFVDGSHGRLHKDQIIPFPSRYDGNVYSPSDKYKARKIVDISSPCTLFVTVGRLGWFKGWKLMIDAFSFYQENDKSSKLVFIGDGEDEKQIRDYVKSLGLMEKVILVGRKRPTEISQYLNAADVFVMGSFEEGWSTTLVEACACGIPCVVTEFSSAREMIEDGKNGYVVEDRDENLFASKMTLALNIPRKDVIEYNKKFAKLDISHLKKVILEILKSKDT